MYDWGKNKFEDENKIQNLLVGIDNKLSVIDLYGKFKRIKTKDFKLCEIFFIYQNVPFSQNENNFVLN